MKLLKLNWYKILAIVVIQCLVGYCVFIAYLLFSWMFLGEGGDSLLYTPSNKIVWALSPVIGATILNSHRISKGLNANDQNKVQTYSMIQLLFFIAYLIFTIVKLSNNGYRI